MRAVGTVGPIVDPVINVLMDLMEASVPTNNSGVVTTVISMLV